MQEIEIKPRYYKVKEIKELEHCGRDRAYELARELEHEKRGNEIYVFADAYEDYYREKREKARNNIENQVTSNVYNIRRFN